MLLSIFLPFCNFLLISLFGRFLGRLGVMYLTCYHCLILVLYNSLLFYHLIKFNYVYYINLGIWFNVSHLTIYWDFIFDFLAGSMLLMVCLISTLVHVYSFAYMKTDPHFIRFISFLSLFTFFMFILVTANNFIQLFLGWEGVGLCSYLLINFWFTRLQANKAAIKALLMNRIGDIGFLIGSACLFNLCSSLDFTILTVLLPVYAEFNFFYLRQFNYIDWISFFFIIGVIGKSAQLGLHTWLPAAMEGPTPVSALIHAATMVTAGIFLLMRSSFLFELSIKVKLLIVILGMLTALISAVTALFLYDIKKIIAYSTCSQIGYMAVACGLAQYSSSLFHLINHAFFKALLFLAAGAIIHSLNNEQDIRRLSLLFFKMPFLWIIFLIGNIAIMGLPFLSGYYSKDLIIESLYFNRSLMSAQLNWLFVFILTATFFTGLYSFRLTYYLFFKESLSKQLLTYQQPFFIQLVLLLLAIFSCCSGFSLSEIYSPFFNGATFIFNNNSHGLVGENEWLPWYIKLAPLFVNSSSFIIYCSFIFFLSSFFYFEYYSFVVFKFIKEVKIVIQNNFYFNEFYNYLAALNFHFYYRSFFLIVDKGVLELIGPSGLFWIYRTSVFYISWFYYQNLFLQLLFLYNSFLCYFFYCFFLTIELWNNLTIKLLGTLFCNNQIY